MRLFLILLLSIWGALNALNDFIRTNPVEIDFDQTVSGEIYSEELWIINQTGSYSEFSIEITNTEFSLSDSEVFIQNGDSVCVEIEFSGVHNIAYEAVMIINSLSESYSKALSVSALNHFNDEYDATTYNLYDNQLKSALNGLVSGHNSLGYIPAKEAMFGYIDNENDQVQCVYTGEWYGIPEGEMPNQNVFNCEHTWPQSYGAEGTAKSDLHHLFPTFANVNSIRGNYPFGNVVTSNWTGGGSKRGYDQNENLVFEVRDAHKGDCARAMFYFAIRYGNLENYLTQQENTLRQWYVFDPVSNKETQRNNSIDNYQNNRNPFVDHPEFLERIHSISINSVSPPIAGVDCYPQEIDFGLLDLSESGTRYLTIVNPERAAQSITDIVTSSDYITIESTPAVILPNDYVELQILFNSDQIDLYNENITVYLGGLSYTIPVIANVQNVSSNVAEASTDFYITFYPNPVALNENRADINFTTNREEQVNISLYNIRGKKLMTVFDGYTTADQSEKLIISEQI
ncbi:MAG: endonuclease, partial [Candidatus Cloacimonetes bacterium]|nr:endonuclease [Candidatus Cloacimonadota bacterium]